MEAETVFLACIFAISFILAYTALGDGDDFSR